MVKPASVCEEPAREGWEGGRDWKEILLVDCATEEGATRLFNAQRYKTNCKKC